MTLIFFHINNFIWQGVCYVTNVAHILAAKVEWERKTNNAIIDYVVVQRLPRDASVEWHLWAHRGNSRFDCTSTSNYSSFILRIFLGTILGLLVELSKLFKVVQVFYFPHRAYSCPSHRY